MRVARRTRDARVTSRASAASARPARPLAAGARERSGAVAAGNRAAATAANAAEGANARERALFLGAGAPEAPGAPGAGAAGGAAARARRRESARKAGRKALASLMAVVLAVGLMPLPAFGDDGSLKGVSFNGNLVAASEATTATVDKDGNVTGETTQSVVDSDGNVETNTVTIGGERAEALDPAASAYGQSLLSSAEAGKSTLAGLQGHDATESGLSTSAIIAADKAQREADEAKAEEQAEAGARAAYDAEDAALDIGGLDDAAFATQRIVVALNDGAQLQQRDLNNVASEGSGLYVLEYKNIDAAKRAYVRYTQYDGAAFVAPDQRVEAAADGDGDEGGDADDDGDGAPDGEDADPAQDTDAAGSPDGDATEAEQEAPVADLGSLEGDAESLESGAARRGGEEATKPAGERAAVIALVDTAVPADAIEKWNGRGHAAELVGRVSAIGGSQPDEVSDGSHGAKMLETILESNPDAKVLSIEALDGSGYGSAATVYAALKLAEAAKADVVNMSFAGYDVEGNDAIEAGVEELREAAEGDDRPAALVAAAGNQGQDARFFVPASYDGVTAVGALDASKEPFDPADPAASRLASSNYGDGLLWAPAESTSYAAARATGALSAMGAQALSGDWAAELQAALLGGAAGDGREQGDGDEADGQTVADEAPDSPDSPDGGTAIEAADGSGRGEGVDGANDAAVRGLHDSVRTRLAQEGVVAQAGVLSVSLGHSFTKGTSSLAYEVHDGTNLATATTSSWFRLNNTSFSLTGDTNKITRMVITSSAASATGGIAVHVASSCNGFYYWNLPDTLSASAPRHKSWTVVFRVGLSTAEAKSFLEQAVYFITPAGAPTGELVGAAARITVQAQCNTSTTDATLLNGVRTGLNKYAKLSTYTKGDGADHFYQLYATRAGFATHYANAKKTYVDGMKGYLATPTSTEEDDLLLEMAGTHNTTSSSTDYRQFLTGINVYAWASGAKEADTWSATGKTKNTVSSTPASNWVYQCGPEAGTALTSTFSGSGRNWASGNSEWTHAYNGASWNDVDGNLAQWGAVFEYSPYNRTSPTTTGSATFSPYITVTYSPNYTDSRAGSFAATQAVLFDAAFTTQTAAQCRRSGYELAGWTSAANGSGNSHAPGGSVAASVYTDDQTLYAKWTAVTVTADLGHTWKTGSAEIEHDTSLGTAKTTKWFQLNDTSFAVSGNASLNKITRLVVTSTAATSTSGIFVHVPASYGGYSYFLQKDALGNAAARHKSYTVIFKVGLTAAQAKDFVENAVYFVTPGAAGASPTASSIANSGATVSIRAESAATSDSSWLASATSGQLTLSGVSSGDSSDHYYVYNSNANSPAAQYNLAKQTVVDGMWGYLVTPANQSEHDLAISFFTGDTVNTAGKKGQLVFGIERYKWNTAAETLTWTSAGKTQFANSSSGAYWSYANGPEAGVTPVTVYGTGNWASGDGVWVQWVGAWNDATVTGTAVFEFSGYTRAGQAGASAVFEPSDYVVTFDAGEHSATPSSAMSTAYASSTKQYTVPAPAYQSAAGYRFRGWRVSYGGSTALVQGGDKFTADSDAAYGAGWRDTQGGRVSIASDSTVTLVAQWEKYATYYTAGKGARLCSPGWQAETAPALSEQDALKLSGTTEYRSALTLAGAGEVFVGWDSDGDGKADVQPGDPIEGSTLEFTAVYSPGTASVTPDAPAPAGAGYTASRDDSGATSRAAPAWGSAAPRPAVRVQAGCKARARRRAAPRAHDPGLRVGTRGPAPPGRPAPHARPAILRMARSRPPRPPAAGRGRG